MSFWKSCRKKLWLWGMILGMVFIGIGAFQGQAEVIWKKAVMICLECIGIG